MTMEDETLDALFGLAATTGRLFGRLCAHLEEQKILGNGDTDGILRAEEEIMDALRRLPEATAMQKMRRDLPTLLLAEASDTFCRIRRVGPYADEPPPEFPPR